MITFNELKITSDNKNLIIQYDEVGSILHLYEKDENGEFVNNGVWYYDKNDIHMLIAGAIEAFIKDGISDEVYEEIRKEDVEIVYISR